MRGLRSIYKSSVGGRGQGLAESGALPAYKKPGRGKCRENPEPSGAVTLPDLGEPYDSTPLLDLPEEEFESFFETLLREECDS